jgi:hypothetical protein
MSSGLRTGFSSQVSLRRVGQLFLRELAHGYRGLLIAAAAVAGGIIIFSAIGSLAASMGGAPEGTIRGDGYAGYFTYLLFLGGCIITSFAFREVWHGGGGIAYLTLPGSTLEKLGVKLLLTSVGFAAGSLVLVTAAGAASEALDRLVFGVGHGFFDPFTPAVAQAVVRYIVVQSLFLLGSIWFRKLAFIKTVLAIMVIGVCLGILAMIALRIGAGPHLSALGRGSGSGSMRFGRWSFQMNGTGLQDLFTPGSSGYGGAQAFKIAAEALLIALAPASWVAAYFRLGEAEV